MVVFGGLGQSFAQLHLSFLVLSFVVRVVLFNDSFVLVQVSCVLSELVPLLNQFGRLSLHLPDTRGQFFIIIRQQLYLHHHLVAELLVRSDVFYSVVQNSEVFLQVLDAVICDLLLHFQIKLRVVKGFVLSKLLSQLIREFLAHLLWDKRYVAQLLRQRILLLKFELKTHVQLDLSLKLWT